MDAKTYAYLLYGNLLATCPVKTGNMKNGITITELDDRFIIRVSQATGIKGYNYSRAVNYNKRRTPKEIRNYMWVENTIQQTSKALVGGEVKNEFIY